MTEKELEKIYTEAYKPVYWTAMQLLKNEADAEDVVQDTFVKKADIKAFTEQDPEGLDKGYFILR